MCSVLSTYISAVCMLQFQSWSISVSHICKLKNGLFFDESKYLFERDFENVPNDIWKPTIPLIRCCIYCCMNKSASRTAPNFAKNNHLCGLKFDGKGVIPLEWMTRALAIGMGVSCKSMYMNLSHLQILIILIGSTRSFLNIISYFTYLFMMNKMLGNNILIQLPTRK